MTPHEQVEHWNSTVGVGDGVYAVLDRGGMLDTATRAKAQVLANGEAVVWIKGIYGSFSLDRVRPNGKKAAELVPGEPEKPKPAPPSPPKRDPTISIHGKRILTPRVGRQEAGHGEQR